MHRHQSATAVDLGDREPPRIVAVADCLGRRWAVDPETRTIYHIADLLPGDVVRALTEAAAALAQHSARPSLRLVPAVPGQARAAD